jgi:putative OPT family oligopeptide transporter
VSEKKLPPTAYENREGEEFVPLYSGESATEFTFKSVIAGIILGIIFGAANTYLGLKAGLTISTSIPVAVLTVVVFRLLGLFGVRHHMLEANMSQTIGSASSSVASGVLFTVPALFIWGMAPAWRQITLLAMCGGLLGVLAMIPLRRYLIKQEHGKLTYPEGMACAEVLVASEGASQQAAPVFWGIGVGMFVNFLVKGFKVVSGAFHLALPFKANLSVSVSPPLIGVGWILGIRIASVMVAGGALSAFIIIPLINLWGSGQSEPVFPETVKLITDMSSGEIWNRYIRYIGAGAVAVGGIITLIRSIPTMIESFRLGVGGMRAGGESTEPNAAGTGFKKLSLPRIERDLSMKTVFIGVGIILLILTLVPGILGFIDSIPVRLLASLLIAVFAFFFVTVSARIVGLVGVTSNPTSGMTIATLLGTSLIFYLLGWTDALGKATALMVGTAVCIASSIAGDTSQDLKTGFILGATPRRQQIGELVGVITSAGVVALVVTLLHNNIEGGLGGAELPAPQAVLMKLVVDGVLDQNLPWNLILIGAGISVAASLFRLPVLAFAVGVYLPLDTMAAVFLGGLLRHILVNRQKHKKLAEAVRERGVLFGSGLVGGGGLMGVLLALWVAARGGERISGLPFHPPEWAVLAISLAAVGFILLIMGRVATSGDNTSGNP